MADFKHAERRLSINISFNGLNGHICNLHLRLIINIVLLPMANLGSPISHLLTDRSTSPVVTEQNVRIHENGDGPWPS